MTAVTVNEAEFAARTEVVISTVPPLKIYGP